MKQYGTAIVLAGGSGKRMGTQTHKQYLLIGGKEVLFYSLETFQKSAYIDEIILVTGAGEEEYCRKHIVEKYNLSKVRTITKGGQERYDSVWNGLQLARSEGFIYIHDGARPFVDEELIRRAYDCVAQHGACAAGMPSKDTIKVVDSEGVVVDTPSRSRLWIVQTPQVFEACLIKDAYGRLVNQEEIAVTDDAMVVEQVLGHKVVMFPGSYENIKITTPEDLTVAEAFIQKIQKK